MGQKEIQAAAERSRYIVECVQEDAVMQKSFAALVGRCASRLHEMGIHIEKMATPVKMSGIYHVEASFAFDADKLAAYLESAGWT
jgi:hypothetical protein